MTHGCRFARVLVATSMFPLALTLAAGACSKPKAPELTPQEATITAVDLSGFDMRVKMDAYNPNGFPLAVRTVSARVVVDGTQDLGTVTSTQPISLPASAHTTLDVPMNVKWRSVGGLATIAAAQRPVPYVLDGTATIGGESLNVDVPFRMQGVLTAEQLQNAAMKSLQNLPGLQGLPGLMPPK